MPVQLSVLLPDPPVMLVGTRVHVRPVAGEMLLARATVPVKPLTGITIMVVVPGTPGVVLTMAELANIWKSTTCTVTVLVVWDNDPLVPVTVTV